MRIQSSYFLLPVFLFSLVVSPNVSEKSLLWTFVIVHIFLYPVSNGFSDKNRIADPENSQRVNKGLYYVILLANAVAIILGYLEINLTFALMVLVYLLFSKASSLPLIRRTRYPVFGWLAAGLLKGMFTFTMCYIGINRFLPENILKPSVLIPAGFTGLMFVAGSALTQLHQRSKGGQEGDQTFSLQLRIPKTYYIVAAVFLLDSLGCFCYFNTLYGLKYALVFLASLAPTVLYFVYCFRISGYTISNFDYRRTMRLRSITATSLNLFFVYLFLYANHYIQVFE